MRWMCYYTNKVNEQTYLLEFQFLNMHFYCKCGDVSDEDIVFKGRINFDIFLLLNFLALQKVNVHKFYRARESELGKS